MNDLGSHEHILQYTLRRRTKVLVLDSVVKSCALAYAAAKIHPLTFQVSCVDNLPSTQFYILLQTVVELLPHEHS